MKTAEWPSEMPKSAERHARTPKIATPRAGHVSSKCRFDRKAGLAYARPTQTMVRMKCSGLIALSSREVHVQPTDVQQHVGRAARCERGRAGWSAAPWAARGQRRRADRGERARASSAPAGGQFAARLSCAPSSLQGNGLDASQHIAI